MRASSVLHACLLFTLLLTACASPNARQDLPNLIVQRLGWMDEVAQVKKARSLPVTDARREAELLSAMAKAGAEKGLPATAVRAFFSGQIESAKVCQAEWLAQHARQPIPASKTLPDLATAVRPALDAIGKQMLTALAEARRQQNAPDIISAAQQQLSQAGYSQAVARPALHGLRAALE